MKIATIFSW